MASNVAPKPDNRSGVTPKASSTASQSARAVSSPARRPALLIAFLAASRRAERSPDSKAHTAGFDRWHGPRERAAGVVTGSVTAGFGGGYAIDLPAIGTSLESSSAPPSPPSS